MLDIDQSDMPTQAYFRKRILARGAELAERREARAAVGVGRSSPSETKQMHAEIPPGQKSGMR
jgi:hypothetical protein